MDALLNRDPELELDVGQAPITVLALAPEELVWCGIRLMLGRPSWLGGYLVGSDLDEAALLAEAHRPELVLIDMTTPGCSPEEACSALRAVSPLSRLLLLSSAPYVPGASVEALGADGFISKTWPSSDVVHAVHRAGLGLPPATSGTALEHGLSERQLEVLRLLAEGRTNDEIAVLLNLSPNTVKQHTSAVYRKLEVRNRAAAIGSAQAMGLLG